MKKIIIVGMARSGTTLLSHILGSLPNVHNEVEPHALWRSGNFNYLNDEDFSIESNIVTNIKTKFLKGLNKLFFVEKSPINSLRPKLVHAVFPEAKIVYIERNPAKCIYSNYRRSLSNDSFKLSIILKKYLYYTGSTDLSGAISKRSLVQQINISDISDFCFYTLKMMWLRNMKKHLPFGPKLRNFDQIVKERGLEGYHIEVYKKSKIYKNEYQKLYGDQIFFFKLEDLMTDKSEIKRLVDFTGIPYKESFIDEIATSFDAQRVSKALSMNEAEKKIQIRLQKEFNT